MGVLYTWKVTGLKVKNQINSDGDILQDAVVQTYWEKRGQDEHGREGSFSGATPFSAEDVPAGQFTRFENLTEETILGWIKPLVTGIYEERVNAQILEQIEQQANPTNDAELPWT